MMKKLPIVLFLAFIFNAQSIKASMKALSNKDLGMVKAQVAKDREKGVNSSGDEQSQAEVSGYDEEPGNASTKSQLTKSPEYRRFLVSVKKLEKFSKTDNYTVYLNSEPFFNFCKEFAGLAGKCQNRLNHFITKAHNDKIKSFLEKQKKIFSCVSMFYEKLLSYKNNGDSLPSLQDLLLKLHSAQNQFGLNMSD